MSVVGNVYSLKNLSNISPKDVVLLFSTQNSDREGDLPGTFFFRASSRLVSAFSREKGVYANNVIFLNTLLLLWLCQTNPSKSKICSRYLENK